MFARQETEGHSFEPKCKTTLTSMNLDAFYVGKHMVCANLERLRGPSKLPTSMNLNALYVRKHIIFAIIAENKDTYISTVNLQLQALVSLPLKKLMIHTNI